MPRLPQWTVTLLLAAIVSAVAVAEDYTFAPALPAAEPARMALIDIASCDGRLLAAGERGLVAFSDDRGETWSQSSVPVSQHLTALDCVDGQRALAVGHGGVILASTDGGATWSLKFDGYEANRQWLDHVQSELERLERQVEEAGDAAPEDLLIAAEEAAFAVEDAQSAIETGPADPFLDVLYLDAQRAIAVGAYGMLYRSLDGGESWELTAGGIDNPYRYHYYAVVRAPGGDLFMSGEAGLLYRSRDGGVNWDRLQPGYDGSLFGVLIDRSGDAITFGLRGNVLRSADGGETWQPVAVEDDPQASLYGGARLGDDSIALVGAGGTVLHRGPGGGPFLPASLPGRSTLSAVAGPSLRRALVVGLEGVEPMAEALP